MLDKIALLLTGFQGSVYHNGHSSPTLHGCTVPGLAPSYWSQ